MLYDDAMTTTETTTHRLTGWDEDWNTIGTSVKALLFGKLMDEAVSVIDHYRSDWYHDALWIERNVTGPTSFYFGMREFGTSIGHDRTAVMYGNDVTYAVTLSVDGGEWFVSLDLLGAKV